MGLILDKRGNPMHAPTRSRASMNGTNRSVFPYDASNWSTQEMGDWLPWIRSPDSEINAFRDRMVARSRDLVRNDGWASGGITRILDTIIGTHLRLSANPDHRFLAYRFGKQFDAVWADEFRRAAEAIWRNYSENLGRYSDVNRLLTIGQQMRLGMRHKLIDGDSLIVAYWMPERLGYGAADYATSFLLVDPDRLSNPNQMVDTQYMRGGVEIDDDGVPVAYHIRKAEQNDWYNAIEANTWERIEREDPEDGWRRVIHDYDGDRAGQHRGIGVFTPVLGHAKMLARYYGVELQQATIAATFGTYVTSPYDPALVQDALDGGDDSELPMYQNLRANWAQERPAMLNGARVPTLAPGESIESVSSDHPHGNFSDFAGEMLGIEASCVGLSREEYTQNWSKSNYSNSRAAALVSWKTLLRRRSQFANNTATPMYATVIQEAMELGDLPMPRQAPDFSEAATAYARCNWLGPARGWIDPVKERQGAILGMDAGLSTLQRECAEQGLDWEEMIEQRAIEMREFEARGLPLPNWYGNDAMNAQQTQEEPQPE